MRSPLIALGAVAAVACGGATDPTPRQPMSYEQHIEQARASEREAQRHDRAAEAATDAPASYQCGVNPASEQATSGTERLTTLTPCWSVEREASERHRREADKLRAEARQHRAIARGLVDVERTFCGRMADDELTHTPFWHEDDIAEVAPYREHGTVLGAQVRFARVEGLTVEWMEQALLCHRARVATLGYDPRYMAYDPALLPSTHVAVDDTLTGLIVTIRADDADTGAVVWSRAQALVTR